MTNQERARWLLEKFLVIQHSTPPVNLEAEFTAALDAAEQRGSPRLNDALEALEFAHGAILDAIGLEEGLDGAAGMKVLTMIRAALTTHGRTPPDLGTIEQETAPYVDTLQRLEAAAEQRGAGRGETMENEQLDIPLDIRRELMRAAAANGSISYHWLCAVYRRGRMELSDAVEALRVAAPEFCSLKCPSQFPTKDSPRHIPACDAIRAALAKADGPAPSPPQAESSTPEGA